MKFTFDKKKIVSYIFICIFLFILVSLLVYDSEDIKNYHFPNDKAQNWGMSYIAHFLFFWLGFSSYIFVTGSIVSSLLILKTHTKVSKIATITLFTTLWFSLAFSFYDDTTLREMPSYGGMLGTTIYSFITTYLGKATTTVFVLSSVCIFVWIAFTSLEKHQLQKLVKRKNKN